ncbi:MAG: DUF58 domain-containing protein [Bacteroidales bacterium]|nr:DUF58 domain-containing protein [Bacteroidales bacterium]
MKSSAAGDEPRDRFPVMWTMLPEDILRQVRRLQIRARRAVTSRLTGAYHSAFKGAGLTFVDARPYQPGDDVRRIDWNLTARTGQPFLKRFSEDREQTILLVVDLSRSLHFGTGTATKRTVAAELAALIAFTALENHDRIGFLGFTDRIERHVPPGQGVRHILRLLRDILYYEPASPGTDLTLVLDAVGHLVHRRAVLFLMSDFLDTGYDVPLRRLAQQHDLILIRIQDARERSWPPIGLVQFEDAETGEQQLVDTASRGFAESFAQRIAEQDAEFQKRTRTAGVDGITISTSGNHAEELIRFFHLRERRLRHG